MRFNCFKNFSAIACSKCCNILCCFRGKYNLKTHRYSVQLSEHYCSITQIGTITALLGKLGEHRKTVIEKATGAVSKQALEDAPDDQPLVAIEFGKNGKQYHYAMAALSPNITAEIIGR